MTAPVLIIDNEAICQLIRIYREVMDLICKDFFLQKTKYLTEARVKCRIAREVINKLKSETTDYASVREVKILAEQLQHIDNIRIHQERLINSIEKKVNRKVMFSIWAVDEVNDLISGTKECLDKLTVYILNGDYATGKWLISRSEKNLQTCNEYSNKHRERFFQGTCLLESRAIYQPILDAFYEIIKSIKSCAETFFHSRNLSNSLLSANEQYV